MDHAHRDTWLRLAVIVLSLLLFAVPAVAQSSPIPAPDGPSPTSPGTPTTKTKVGGSKSHTSNSKTKSSNGDEVGNQKGVVTKTSTGGSLPGPTPPGDSDK